MRTAKPSTSATRNAPTDTQPPLETLPAPDDSPWRNDELLRQRIAEAAYFHAEQRGFAPGHELDDWLAAEAEIVGHSLERMSIVGTTRSQ